MSSALLDPDEALARIGERCVSLPGEPCTAAAASGRVLHEALVSPTALPPFDNSAMDGYALAGGADAIPAGTTLPIEGEQAAGAGAIEAHDGAWAIMTGARVPAGLDRVIPVERTEKLDDPPRVRLTAAVEPGRNIRRTGSDVACGETVIDAGICLAPQHLMLLTALGVAEVTAVQRPRVAVVNTGRELIDDPAQPLDSGQIYNSNGPFLRARIPLAGAELAHMQTIDDDIDALIAGFDAARASGAHIIASTGAVSAGRYDFVPEVLKRMGATIVFHKLAIRPGKPLLFAHFDDGTLFFGLPGNPISAAVGWRFFVEPALRNMLGMGAETPWRVPLATAYEQQRRLRCYLKSCVMRDTAGRAEVTVLPGQQSYRIRPLAQANAWVVMPADADSLATGTLVDVYGPGHLQSPAPGWRAP
jgi:molybdopterin molybdotransferase